MAGFWAFFPGERLSGLHKFDFKFVFGSQKHHDYYRFVFPLHGDRRYKLPT